MNKMNVKVQDEMTLEERVFLLESRLNNAYEHIKCLELLVGLTKEHKLNYILHNHPIKESE